jgi:hypothetical protein
VQDDASVCPHCQRDLTPIRVVRGDHYDTLRCGGRRGNRTPERELSTVLSGFPYTTRVAPPDTWWGRDPSAPQPCPCQDPFGLAFGRKPEVRTHHRRGSRLRERGSFYASGSGQWRLQVSQIRMLRYLSRTEKRLSRPIKS